MILEWFYLNREIGSRILRTNSSLVLLTSRYFVLFISISFTVEVKSL